MGYNAVDATEIDDTTDAGYTRYCWPAEQTVDLHGHVVNTIDMTLKAKKVVDAIDAVDRTTVDC